MDIRYKSFDLFLDKPRAVKTRKTVTNRIITKEDIQNILDYIKRAYHDGRLDIKRALTQYTALTLFGAYTGQRSMATISKDNCWSNERCITTKINPCIHILPSQDKIKMEHYVGSILNYLNLFLVYVTGRTIRIRYLNITDFSMWIKRENTFEKMLGTFLF